MLVTLPEINETLHLKEETLEFDDQFEVADYRHHRVKNALMTLINRVVDQSVNPKMLEVERAVLMNAILQELFNSMKSSANANMLKCLLFDQESAPTDQAAA